MYHQSAVPSHPRWTERVHARSSRSQQCTELLSCQLAVPEDLREQAGAERLAGVDRYYSRMPVAVTHEMMAPLDANHLKPNTSKGLDAFLSGDAGELTHGASGRNGDTLHSNKVEGFRLVGFDFQA